MSIFRTSRAVRALLGASIALGTLGVFAACSDSAAPETRRATTMRLYEGDFQSNEVAKPIAGPLSVEVRDQHGMLMSSAVVRFSSNGNGSFTQTEALSDSMGIASTFFTLGTTMGLYTVTADVDGISTPVLFTLVARPGQAMQLAKVDGDAQVASPGLTLEPFVVKCLDLFGNPVSGLTVTWTLVGDGILNESLNVTGEDGTASVMLTLGSGSGTRTVVAHVQNLADVQFIAATNQ